jgi:hypothetical protein
MQHLDSTEFDRKLRDLASRYTNAPLKFLQEHWDRARTRPTFMERLLGEESNWFGPDMLHVGRDSNTGARFLADQEGLVLNT